MGMEIENPLEFLENAKAAVSEYQATEESLRKQRELEKETSVTLEQAKRDMTEKVEKTLKKRADEIAETYDRQTAQIDAKIKKAAAARDKAKSLGVKGRIAAETEALVTENKELKRQVSAVLSKDHAPLFCRSGLFYTWFMPRGFGEICGWVISFIILFAALPFGIYYFIPQHSTWQLVVIYILDIIIFGGLYLAVNNSTKVHHRDAISQCRDIRSRIKGNKHKIKAITHAIRTDSSETGYNLEEYDDEIAKAKQDRTDIISQKQSAQNTFETVTKNIITDEIETAAKPQMDELIQKLSDITRARGTLESKEKEQALNLSRVYETYLGKKHMNAKDIGRIHDMLSSKEAGSIIDAVTKLDNPTK